MPLSPSPTVSRWRCRNRFPDGTLALALVVLVATILIFEVWLPWDLNLQDQLYDRATGQWLIPATAVWPRLLFYTGPKFAIIAFGVGLLGALAIAPTRRPRWLRRLPGRAALGMTVLTLIATPAVVGVLKATTNIQSPWSLARYGGTAPYVRLFEPRPPLAPGERPSRGWPSGHASGGFALLSLVGWASTRRGQAIGLGIGLATGGIMGAYQMAKGAHYLSHVLVTALLAWIFFLLARRLLGPIGPRGGPVTRP